MVSKRDRVIILKEYLESNGIRVNIGKTKARGNKGFFLTKDDSYRIDIAKNLDDDSVFSTLLHEYAHYIHYKYDKTLKSYDFLFPDINDEILDELINVSVQFVSKDYAENIFKQKKEVVSEINSLSEKLKFVSSDFSLSKPCKSIESSLGVPACFLLKYDKIRFMNRIYDIDNIDLTGVQSCYLHLKQSQRKLKRINSRISKLNSYYNKPTELISRFVELYFTDPQKSKMLAPMCTLKMDKCISSGKIPEFSKLKNHIINN